MAKIKFGLQHRNADTPQLVRMIFKVIKRVCVIGGTSAMVMSHEYVTLGLMLLSGVIDEIEPYFGEENEPKTNS